MSGYCMECGEPLSEFELCSYGDLCILCHEREENPCNGCQEEDCEGCEFDGEVD